MIYEPMTRELRQRLERQRLELQDEGAMWLLRMEQARRMVHAADAAITRINKRLTEPDPFGRPPEAEA